MFKGFYPIRKFHEWMIYNISIPLLVLLGLLMFISSHWIGGNSTVSFLLLFAWPWIMMLTFYFRDKYLVLKWAIKNYNQNLFQSKLHEIRNSKLTMKISRDNLDKFLVKKDSNGISIYVDEIKVKKLSRAFLSSDFIRIIYIVNPSDYQLEKIFTFKDKNDYVFLLYNDKAAYNEHNSIINPDYLNVHPIFITQGNRFHTYVPTFIIKLKHNETIWKYKNVSTNDVFIYDHFISRKIRNNLIKISSSSIFKKLHYRNMIV